MSVLIVDKETNKHFTVSASESNNRKAPNFSGTGSSQDPLQFIENFNKAAKWNNWKADDRKKETFLLCLSGHAERLVTNHLMHDLEEFDKLAFEDEQGKGLLLQFKTQYVTEKWYEIYTKKYEERKRINSETPLEYLEAKRYHFQRAGPECGERSIKQKVREIMKGLTPEVARFCPQKLKDPFNHAARTTFHTLEGIEKLLKWAEHCLYGDRKTAHGSHDEVETSGAPMVLKRDGGSKEKSVNHVSVNQGTRNDSSIIKVNSEFERAVLNKLNKLDIIENDLALLKDRVSSLEENENKPEAKQRFNGFRSASNSKIKCFNCENTGHYARECPDPCGRCEISDHVPEDCPRRLLSYQAKIKQVESKQKEQHFPKGSPRA